MTAYYNEIDPYAAAWLRNLIAAGHLPAGDVDERSIVDVGPDDLRGYRQCHFFAGIGGWPHALRLAGWPDDRPVWTGSCPCQPLSSAGKRRGHADERHLWPAFHRLISERAPAIVFGEQVASKDGREWFAGVRADLEDLGYACGAADLCAAGVGAPHIRQRIWWVGRLEKPESDRGHGAIQPSERKEVSGALDASAIGTGGLADADVGRAQRFAGDDGETAGVSAEERSAHGAAVPQRGGATGGLADADDAGPQGRLDGPGEGRRADQRPAGAPGVAGFWSDFTFIPCSDGKARRTGPGIFPLAHGVPNRVGRLRAYGNAIVPQVAAEFIRAAA